MDLTISRLENMKLKELYELAREFKVTYYSKLTKKELIFAILKSRAEQARVFFHGRCTWKLFNQRASASCGRSITHQAQKIFIFLHRKFAASIFEMGIKYPVKYVLQKKMNVIIGLLQVEAVNGDDPESAKERVSFPSFNSHYIPNRK